MVESLRIVVRTLAAGGEVASLIGSGVYPSRPGPRVSHSRRTRLVLRDRETARAHIELHWAPPRIERRLGSNAEPKDPNSARLVSLPYELALGQQRVERRVLVRTRRRAD